MKKHRVIVTPDAENDLRKYLNYLKNVKKNPQAVKNVLEDFKETKEILSDIADSLPDPDNDELHRRGLKRVNFKRHNYFLLFYIAPNNVVYITNMFHGLENFEQKLR